MSLDDVKKKVGEYNIILEDQLSKIVLGSVIALDIETFGDGKNPGDCFKSLHHGIAGVSFCDGTGNAYYVPMKYKNKQGVGAFEFCRLFSDILQKSSVKTIITHYGKFDYGFLWSHGLKIPDKCVLVDTWILNSLDATIGGEFKSNKLKELAREKLGVSTSTEEEKDNAMKALNTKDYGELNANILAPYACDDVRYAYLMAGVLCPAAKDTSVQDIHDRIMKAWWNLIYAEDAGIHLASDFDLKLKFISRQADTWRKKVCDRLSSLSLDVDNDQEMLAHFASKNLHPPAWDGGNGEIKFDREYATVVALRDETMRNYLFYRMYRELFRVFSDENRVHDGYFFPGFLASVYSKTGLPVCKSPDLEMGVVYNACFRSLFAAKPGCNFVYVRVQDLYVTLIRGTSFDQLVSAESWLDGIAKKAGCSYEEAQVSLRKFIEGFGFKVYKFKLLMAKDRKIRNDYELWDRFYKVLNASVEQREDYLGRVLKIHPDKNYRRGSIIYQSSYGHLLCHIMNILVDIVGKDGTLVFAHGQDFLFKIDGDLSKAQKVSLQMAKNYLTQELKIDITVCACTRWNPVTKEDLQNQILFQNLPNWDFNYGLRSFKHVQV